MDIRNSDYPDIQEVSYKVFQNFKYFQSERPLISSHSNNINYFLCLSISKFIEAYRNRGYAKLKNGELEEAKNDLNIALQEEPSSPYNHYYLAKYFEKKWQYVKALEQYEKARDMGIGLHGIDFEIEEVKRQINT